MAKLATKFTISSLNQIEWAVLAGPILILLILSMMILPLPAFILDMMFTFNIVLSLMILMVAMFTQKTLDFSAFPTVLLFATMLRLALNIASTRVILMNGHTGAGAAGQVVEAFGHFLVGGNFAIGIVVFAILIVINFMVITKGAGRIAEVGARFVLDGMPGKQMAIDADLNAGLIGEAEAKIRRNNVTQEADFYGSMDGASKFVRGDAVAGLIIMAITIIGGLMVGTMQYDMTLAEAGQTFTLLTIGDGLVSQIPALIISTAAGVIVTRVSTDQDVGEQMIGQLFKDSKVLVLAATVIGLLGVIPGMPSFVFIFFAAVLFTGAWWMKKAGSTPGVTKKINDGDGAMNEAQKEAARATEVSWEDVKMEDVLRLEVGYRLIPMVDETQNGQLLTRIRGIRKKFAQEMGFLPPSIHIRDNMDLGATHYRILLKGVEIGRGVSQPDRWMAINPGCAEGVLSGTPCHEPAFGLPAVWIEEGLREQAQTLGYTVVDPSSVIATHLNHLLAINTSELFSRQETVQLLERLNKEMPKLVEDLIPGVIPLTLFHRVLQNLLSERIPIRDMRTIVDTLATYSTQTDPDELTALVRIQLGRAITQQWFPGDGDIQVIGLDLQLEQLLIQTIQSGSAIEPGIAEKMMQQTDRAIVHQESLGVTPVLLVNQPLRAMLSNFLRRMYPQLVVLSNLELATNRTIKMTATIGGQE